MKSLKSALLFMELIERAITADYDLKLKILLKKDVIERAITADYDLKLKILLEKDVHSLFNNMSVVDK